MTSLSFGDALTTCLRKYVVFSGRASRSEYWWFFLAAVAAMFAGTVLDTLVFPFAYSEITGLGPVGGLIALLLMLPTMAVGARRMHDIGRPAWWLLVQLVPLVGAVVFAVLASRPGTRGPNTYGPDPVLARAGSAPRWSAL